MKKRKIYLKYSYNPFSETYTFDSLRRIKKFYNQIFENKPRIITTDIWSDKSGVCYILDKEDFKNLKQLVDKHNQEVDFERKFKKMLNE